VNERLDRWLDALLATPGLTSLRDPAEARRVHLDESLAAAEVVRLLEGPIIDVGSGGGAPGIPLAAAFPERPVTLLEANGRKCAFLRVIPEHQHFPQVQEESRTVVRTCVHHDVLDVREFVPAAPPQGARQESLHDESALAVGDQHDRCAVGAVAAQPGAQSVGDVVDIGDTPVGP
jgi:hypothetical protein